MTTEDELLEAGRELHDQVEAQADDSLASLRLSRSLTTFTKALTAVTQDTLVGDEGVDAEVASLLAEQRAHVAETRRQQWEAICPARFAKVTWADVKQPPECLSTVQQWLAAARAGSGSNLLLLGPLGTGKTFMALAAGRELHFANRRVVFRPVVEMLDDLRPGHDKNTADFCEPDVLILDDLAVEKTTEWTLERLYLVINRRWLERRSTIVTTNLEPEVLRQQVGARTYDRLRDGATAVRLVGDTRRR